MEGHISISPDVAAFLEAVERERGAWDELSRADENGREDIGEVQAAWHNAVAKLCRCFAKMHMHPGVMPPDFPAEAASRLGDIFSHLSRGRTPPALKVRRRGRPSATDGELGQMHACVRYILAVRAGLIADADPIATVAVLAGRSVRTVYIWCEKYPDVEIGAKQPNRIIAEMKCAADNLKYAGDGHEAIRGRSAKRSRQ